MKIAVDIETYDKQGKPVLDARSFTIGCLVTEDGKQESYTNEESMWNRILELGAQAKKKREHLYVYGHHHSYDFCGYAKNHLLEVLHVCWDPFLAIKDNIYFCDSMSFYPTSLEELGKSLGNNKGTMPEQITKPEELIPYCMQDCIITLQAIQKLQETFESIGFPIKKMLTAGQVAMTSWQTYIKDNNLYYGVMNKGKIFKSLNWKTTKYAYRGARCQAFQRGTFEDSYLMDVHSMYPYVMSTMRFPDLATSYWIENPERKDYHNILDCIGVLYATITVPITNMPYLPVWDGKRQQYPGEGQTITGTWTIGEIAYAITIGYTIEHIHWAECYFDNDTNPFTNYMETLYTIRKESKNFVEKQAIKLLMNNLYGKFSQHRSTKSLLLIERNNYEPEMGKTVGTTGIHYIVEQGNEEMIRDFTNPMISALITAGARTILYKKMKEIPREDLLYCDTDSILFKGRKNKIHFNQGSAMGEWELKAEGTAIIHKEKAYSIGEEIHISGLSKKLQTKKVFDEPVATKRMIGLLEAIKQGNLNLTGGFQEFMFNLSAPEEEEIMIPDNYNEKTRYE